MSRVVDILQPLIRFPSVTPDDAGAQDYLKSLLKPLGFEIFDLPFEGKGSSYKVQNFFARRGNNAPHICFAGHTDVVPVGDEAAWSVPPFSATIKGDSIIGRGTSDMKGQIAAFVAAVEEFLKANSTFNGSISFLITGDEEKDALNGTVRVLEWMSKNGHTPDVCLVGEPSNPDYMGQEIKIGRRGSLTGFLTVKGVQGHVAYPDQANNPLPRLIQYLDALERCVFDKGSAHFPPTNLEITTIDVGNKATNVIPANGYATFNVRFSDRWTIETLKEKINAVLAGVSPDYEIRFTTGAHGFLTQPGEWTKLVSDAVEKITGHKPALTTGGGTSDARFVSQYCPVVEFGMVNKTIHQVDEFCTIPQLEKCTAIYLEILKEYFA